MCRFGGIYVELGGSSLGREGHVTTQTRDATDLPAAATPQRLSATTTAAQTASLSTDNFTHERFTPGRWRSHPSEASEV